MVIETTGRVFENTAPVIKTNAKTSKRWRSSQLVIQDFESKSLLPFTLNGGWSTGTEALKKNQRVKIKFEIRHRRVDTKYYPILTLTSITKL